PEAATLVQGRWLNDQKTIIEMFSKALPANVLLIVKEHKVSVGRRPIEFYQEIDKFHNVYFVPETTEVYPLIENSLGVVTISSSMGLEAVMLNKAVITFGDIHYNILTDVIKATDISKMQEYVRRALNFKKYNEAEYLAFFKVITENVYRMPGYSPHNFSNEHVNTVVSMLTSISN
ncbi:MAG: capsule polysaccharide biosynthesis protein, partial [Mucilaginibacter sp.]|nr:capsule polysaccharide biosynthesis protein [Mucilaginibacter sp.]